MDSLLEELVPEGTVSTGAKIFSEPLPDEPESWVDGAVEEE